MIRWIVRGAFLVALAVVLDVVLSPQLVAGDMPSLEQRVPARTAYMRDAEQEGRRVTRGAFIPLSALPPVLACGVMVAEEPNFWVNGTIDYASQRRMLERIADGDLSKGGSGIVQQLARNLYLSSDRTLRRKLREYAIAYRIAHTISKSRQLELYLNLVEWGPDAWGVDAASRHYFALPPKELTPTQAIILATLLPAPRQSMRFAKSEFAYKRLFGVAYGVWSARLITDTQRAVTLARAKLWQDAVRRGATAKQAWEETVVVMGPEPRFSDVEQLGPLLPPPVSCNTGRRGL